eukprot:symbB.v1.2.008953.t1/scaffold508.1/size221222/2
MGGWNSHPEPEPQLEPEVQQAPHLNETVSPEEILRQLIQIEKQCCPASSAACNWPKEPNANMGPDEDVKGRKHHWGRNAVAFRFVIHLLL